MTLFINKITIRALGLVLMVTLMLSFENCDSKKVRHATGNSESESTTKDDGRVSCPTCEGNQVVLCDICNGKGKAHCGNCGGDGWDGNGNRCLNCDGGGIVLCPKRNGCPSCKGYGYGYLRACSLCSGTGKNENGEPCSCTSMFHNAIGGILSSILDSQDDNEITRNLEGISIEEYPGYLFYAPE